MRDAQKTLARMFGIFGDLGEREAQHSGVAGRAPSRQPSPHNQGRNFPHENIIGSAIVGGGIAAALIGAGIGHADDNHNHFGGKSDGAGPFKAR